MIFVIILPIIIGFGFSIYMHRQDDLDSLAFTGVVLFGIAFIIAAVCSIGLAWNVTSGNHIPEMISMCEEENNQIESQIGELVNKYMEYEGSTFKDLKNEDSVALVSLYPELKSDALVEKQIEVYIENNKKIKNLKKKQIELLTYKWWLYFGK